MGLACRQLENEGCLRRSLFVSHDVKLTLCLKGSIGMDMISRNQFETLVERVVRRISEAVPAPATAKTGNFHYDAAGNTVADEPGNVNPAAKTQMPPTMHPPTIAAKASPTQQQADAELSQMITKNPNRPATAPSQKQIKVNAIKKALDNTGFTRDAEGAKKVTQNLASWYDQLDPADALVATADQLAQRFANGE